MVNGDYTEQGNTEMIDIQWEDPKPSHSKSTEKKDTSEKSMKKYLPFVEELKQKPKSWAVFKRASSPTFSTRLKIAYPGIETTCRYIQSEDGKQRYDIFARWVGEE